MENDLGVSCHAMSGVSACAAAISRHAGNVFTVLSSHLSTAMSMTQMLSGSHADAVRRSQHRAAIGVDVILRPATPMAGTRKYSAALN